MSTPKLAEPETTPDIRKALDDVRAELRAATEAALAGEPNVSAAAMAALERREVELHDLLQRQEAIDAAVAQRQARDAAREHADAVVASVQGLINRSAALPEAITTLMDDARDAVEAVVEAVLAHNDEVDQLREQVAAVGRHLDRTETGLFDTEVGGLTRAVGLDGYGHVGRVDPAVAVLAAVAPAIEPLGRSNGTRSEFVQPVVRAATMYQQIADAFVQVPSRPLTAEEREVQAEYRRERMARADRQAKLEGQLRAIRDGSAREHRDGLDDTSASRAMIVDEETFHRTFPDFVEGASHYEGPLK